MAVNDIGPRIGIDGEHEFRSSINAINAQMKSLGAEMKAVTAEFAANAQSEEALTAKNEVLGRSVQTAKDKLALLDGQLDRQRGKLNDLAAALDQAAAQFGENSKEAATAQNAFNQQYRAVANLEAQYNTARSQLAGFQNAMDGVGESTSAASQALSAQDVLAGMGAWAMLERGIRAATAAMQDAIGVGMDFDSEMSNLAATMGTTVGELGELRDYAQELGKSTVFSATEGAQGLTYLALAGKDAQESMEMLPTTMNLAAAGAMQLGAATDMVTDAQSALGLSLEGTTRLVDEMAKASTKANQSIREFGAGILEVGGTAKVLSGGTAELNQVLGILADNSIKGAEGGTKLRNVILALSAPTDKAAKQLDKLGVSVFDAEGNMRRFSDIFPELQKALSNLTSQEQLSALDVIFNKQDMAAAQALLGTSIERWDELAVAIDNAAGSAERMAETRLDNLAGDLTLLRSAADGAKIAFSDSLTPALRDLTQAGTGILSMVGDAMTKFPALGAAAAGLTAGMGTLTVGMTALKAASLLGVQSIEALGAAIATSPVAPYALGIGVVVTTLTALSHALDDAGEKITDVGRAVEDSRIAWEGQGQAAQAQRQEIEDLTAQLEDLANKEDRTAAEKEQLLAVTNALNQAVPALGLSYDQLTDSLSMTTDQVLALARAQADAQERADTAAAIVRAQRDQAQAIRDTEQAELDLAAAIQARDRAAQSWYASTPEGVAQLAELNAEVLRLQAVLDELGGAIQDSEDQVDEMSGQLEEMAAASGTAADGLDEAAAAAEEAGESAQQAAADFAALEEATLYAAGAADTFSDALKEQERSGSLSLKTTNELIEAGYAAAIVIDQETGAVTLDREAYVQLASAKIQAQMATLEAEKASLEAARAAAMEEAAVRADGSAYWETAKAKAAMTNAGDIQAVELQIAALNRAQASLSNYGAAVTTAAKSSASASKAVKTQAEKDLAAYKDLKAELDHQKAMDLVDEAEYYRQLTDLRDAYLTDAGNLSEYNKVSETLYKADQAALANREKLWQTAGDNILKLEEDFQKELESRAGQIVSSYKLFDEVPERQKKAGTELIANLEDQIASIDSFYSNLQTLSEREVSRELVDEIRKMGVSAAGELEGLLDLTDEQLTKYSDLYAEKQELANRIAMEELEALRKSTNEEILGQLGDVADLYDTNAPALGLAFAENLAAGMFEGMPIVEQMAQSVANAAMAAFESTYNRDVEALMTASGNRGVSKSDIGELLAGAVNGINAGGGNVVYPTVDVTLTMDGQTLARQQVDPMRQAFRERPEVLDDTN